MHVCCLSVSMHRSCAAAVSELYQSLCCCRSVFNNPEQHKRAAGQATHCSASLALLDRTVNPTGLHLTILQSVNRSINQSIDESIIAQHDQKAAALASSSCARSMLWCFAGSSDTDLHWHSSLQRRPDPQQLRATPVYSGSQSTM